MTDPAKVSAERLREVRWPHPGFGDPLRLKLWEIRHQLDVNVQIIMRDHPDPKPRILPHEIETLTDHVYDRLNELEKLLASLNTLMTPEDTETEGWQDIANAPKVVDETVLLRIEHVNYAIASGDDRRRWEEIVTAYWTDFNGGGWVWHGLAGTPTDWCPITPPRQNGNQGCHGLDTPERVCFYEQDFYVLSNFSSFNLRWHGRTFPTSEHAYHWSRFALGWTLGDAEGDDAQKIADLVIKAPSAHEAFKLAQENRDLQHPGWPVDKVDVMRRILFAKADQHEYVRRKLLATGDRELVENSWRDDFWGWGPNRDGKNMLGKLWMEVRAELRQASAPTPEPSTDV